MTYISSEKYRYRQRGCQTHYIIFFISVFVQTKVQLHIVFTANLNMSQILLLCKQLVEAIWAKRWCTGVDNCSIQSRPLEWFLLKYIRKFRILSTYTASPPSSECKTNFKQFNYKTYEIITTWDRKVYFMALCVLNFSYISTYSCSNNFVIISLIYYNQF